MNNKPQIDKLWPLKQGVVGIHVNLTPEQDKQLKEDIKRTDKAWRKDPTKGANVPGEAPMVVHLYDHIFGKNIWVAMGDRDKCEWMLRQLTDTKGDLKGRLSINAGLCFSMTESDIGIWNKETWHDMRVAANVHALSHEAMHASELVCDLAGMKPHRQNEELRAYYAQWITETITQLVAEDMGVWDASYISVKSLYEKKS